MPLTQTLLYYIPSFVLGALIVVMALIMAVTGLRSVRKRVSHQKLKTHNDIAGAIFSTLGVAYAVLLAFVVIVVWQSFDTARQNVEAEANCLADLYRNADGFPKAFQERVKALSTGYARTIVDDEWKVLARGKASPAAQQAFESLSAAYTAYTPSAEREKIFFAESVRRLSELSDLRRMRLAESRSGIHPVLWFVLLTCGIVTITFTFFFGSESPRAQVLMTTLLATLIALILYTILMFDFPFTGDVSIRPDAFRQLLTR